MEDQATYAPHIRKAFLPALRPFLEAGELRKVKDALESHRISTGPKTHAFEEQFKNYDIRGSNRRALIAGFSHERKGWVSNA